MHEEPGTRKANELRTEIEEIQRLKGHICVRDYAFWDWIIV